MLKVAFVGALSASFAESVRAHLAAPCEFVVTDETNVVSLLPEIDVLVTLVFTPAMGAAATRLRLVQVPGAGLDRIDRAALPAAASLANVYGHETGIAEYVLGAMLAMSRGFGRLDAALRVGRMGKPMGAGQRRRRSGRNWPARRSAFSATAISGRRSRAAHAPSTWR